MGIHIGTLSWSGARPGPPQQGNLVLWLDATKITGLSDGAAVTTWADQSSQANSFVQATPANRPVYYSATTAKEINGHPAVSFSNAAQSYMTSSKNLGPLTATFTIAVVAQNQDLTKYPSLFYGADSAAGTNNMSLSEQPGATGYTFSVTGHSILAGTVDTAAHVLIGEDLNPSSSLFLDGNLIAGPAALGASLAAQPTSCWLGANSGLSAVNFLTGQIGELLVWMPALSATDRASAQTYLQTRWGTP